ncbi:hypothetical protein B0H19DRAFT_1225550 [Mycena capillaripes]|nr:hypothetical protein B0H19DRAFT_1225550 [Mycena capillaripes]
MARVGIRPEISRVTQRRTRKVRVARRWIHGCKDALLSWDSPHRALFPGLFQLLVVEVEDKFRIFIFDDWRLTRYVKSSSSITASKALELAVQHCHIQRARSSSPHPTASTTAPMLWTSKRRKSRPEIVSPPNKSVPVPPLPARRSSLGSPRFPFAPLVPHQAVDMASDAQNLYGRPILSLDEQHQVARNSPSPPPNFSLPRRDSDMYTTNQLTTFAFGPATEPPSPGRSIGPLDEVDEDDMRRRATADETPRPSLASTARRDPRTPVAFYSPPRSDAASHHTFGTSSASSLSSPSRSGSRSRTTSSTTHTSVDDSLGGVTFNPRHHHPAVEFDSEEEEFSEEYDLIEVSSARGGGSIEGAQFEAAFERQMYSDPLTARRPSLPMAIPGIAPDDLAGNRREREGSLATLRRPSRSLDDQVSVHTLGERDTNAATKPNTDPVSVPETDGDWRSLSARAAHRAPSPMLTTVPTFAAPSSASPSSGGGFDGLGFDLDWTAMGRGITGLDMSDIAVHARASISSSTRDRRPSQLSLMMLRRPSTASGGSIMNDPDTFLAAVRGWEGEDYDRQRKHWTFRRDAADGRGGGASASPRARQGAGLSPVRSRIGGGTSILSGVGGGNGGHGAGERPKHAPWRGMALNAEEIWNSSLVGSFKVRRIELRPTKPQQRVTIDPFRGPYTLGPKPPHDGAYTNIHKHSKVMAFSIHRHYKPTRALPDVFAMGARGSVSGRGSVSTGSGRPNTAGGGSGGGGGGGTVRGSVSTASGRGAVSGNGYEERRRPTAMILLAPRHVQEAYTSTNTTKGLRSHGLLDEGNGKERERDGTRSTGRDGTRSTGRDGKGEDGRRREKEKEKGRQNGKGKGGSSSSSASTSASTSTSTAKQQMNSTGSAKSAYYVPSPPTQHTYPPSSSHSPPLDPRSDRDFIGPSLAATRSRRRRRDSLGFADDSDDESDSELRSRTTHNEAFSTMDASSIDQMVLAQDARYGEGSNGVLSRVLRRAAGPTHPLGTAPPHQVYIPPWVTLQSRVKQEERRRRHDVLSNSFEDVGLLPPKKSTGGRGAKKVPVTGVDIFVQVPSDALFMLLPLWPGPTDPVSERNATTAPHEIPTEQRQYLLVSYNPREERPPPPGRNSKHDEGGGRKNKGSTHSSPTSSADNGGAGRGCDILLASYHISARLVSHADLQGSGVRVPDEGLAVLGPWREAWLTMPQIATRDHGLLVIGTCASREAGIEFDPEPLLKMGLCVPVPPDPGADDGMEEPVAELTPIGKAVLEMAWIGCVAVTSFGPAGSS